MLGDISAITGGNLTGIAVAFGQAAAEGRVMTRDLRQFINNGVPILQLLSEEMGVAEGKIMDLASEGKLTFDILNTAFTKATSDGGRFNDGLKILSQTLEGLFSTLKDNVNIALAELGQEIAETLNLKEGIPAFSKQIKEAVDNFKNLDPEIRKLIIQLGLFVTAAGPVIVVLGTISASLLAIIALLTALSPIVIAFTALFVALGAAFVAAKKEGVGFSDFLKNNLQAALISDDKFSRFNDNLGTTNDELKILNTRTKTAKERLDDLAEAMEGAFSNPLLFTGARPKGFPKITTDTSTDNTGGFGGNGGDPIKFSFAATDMFAGFGKTVLDVSNLYKKELPNMTTITNGFALAMEEMTKKFQDFTENAIVPVVEATKTFGEQIIPQIGIALRDGFAAIAEGESPLKRIGTILKGLVARLLAAAAAAMLLGAFLGGAGGGSAILTRMGGIKGLFTQFSGIELARGGIVSGPTNALIGEYPGARSNPEVVAPLSKLKTMLGTSGAMQGEFVLRGQDLVVALQRAERNRNRFK
jgi:tape measure domain-containing protein